MGVKLTQQEFESRIRQIHGDKIDISNSYIKEMPLKVNASVMSAETCGW